MPVNRYSTYMKKTTLFIWLAFMLAAGSCPLRAEPFFTGRFERPVTQAALAAQTPLFSLHFNDTSRQDAFNTALGLAALVPPPGQKSFAQIRKAEYPGVRDVHVIVAVRADVARQLQANGIPVSSLRNADAYTTSFVGKDGKRVIHIFLISDVLAAGRTSEQLLAAAAVAAALEIYGHAYYKMTHPIDTSDMQKEEPLAYGRSVAFVENLLASHLAEKLSPAQKKAFEEALAREKKLQSRYK